jgi:hypothetical protein
MATKKNGHPVSGEKKSQANPLPRMTRILTDFFTIAENLRIRFQS